MADRKHYPSDLTDAQWQVVGLFVRGNPVDPQPVVHSRREVLNAIIYVSCTGVQWCYLPHDFPDWQSVYSYFRQWKKNGALKLIHDALRGKVASGGGPKAPALRQHSRQPEHQVGCAG